MLKFFFTFAKRCNKRQNRQAAILFHGNQQQTQCNLLTYSFTRHFFLFWFTTLYIYNSLSFTPGLKPTSFTNPTPVVSFLPLGLPPRTTAWTISSELLGFYVMFLYFFVFGPSAGLKLAISSAFESTLIYHIVSWRDVGVIDRMHWERTIVSWEWFCR